MDRLKYILLILMIPAHVFALDATLYVTERAGVSRSNDPVSYGVPVSESENILNADTLQVVGEDAQFRVIARYNGTPTDTTKPIRMVLVDFQDDVSAEATDTFTFNNSGSGTVSGDDLVSLTANVATIDTGSVKAIIKGVDTSIFDEVWVDPTNTSTYSTSNKVIDEPVNDGLIVDYNSTLYYPSTTRSVSIEENGPLRCVVKIKGDYSLTPPVFSDCDNTMSYTIRITAYKNKSYLKTNITFENENRGWALDALSWDIDEININSCYAKTTLNGLGSKTVQFGSDHTETGYTTGEIKLLQQETSDGTASSYTWDYDITGITGGDKTGTKYDDGVDVRNNTIGMMVASRWFWQNTPKAIRVSDDEVYFDLWPDIAIDHRIVGGTWKTHELIYYFHGSDTTFTDEMATLKKRLIAKCSSDYYADTDFFAWIPPENISTDYTFPAGETLSTAVTAHNDRIKAPYDSNFDGTTIQEAMDERAVKYDSTHYTSWYGWQGFGNTPSGSGFGVSNQHYGWSYIPTLAFLRFGTWEAFDIAEIFVSNKADYSVIHDPTAWDATTGSALYYDNEFNGGQRYESDSTYTIGATSNGNRAPGSASHFWTKGLAMQYLLSGDYRILQALTECWEHIVYVKDDASMKSTELRKQSRGIEAMLNGWEIVGDTRYLDTAYQLYTQITDLEGGTGDGTSGWIKDSSTTKISVGYNKITISTLVKLHGILVSAGETSKASDVKSFLIRHATWRKTILGDMYSGALGTYQDNNTEYMAYRLIKGWFTDTEEWDYSGSLADYSYAVPYADLFAWMYAQGQGQDWLNVARNIFKDYAIYGDGIQNTPVTTPTWQTTITGSPEIVALQNYDIQSAWAKYGKTLTRPMYYLKVESDINSTTVTLPSDFSTTESPTTYTGTSSAPDGETISTVVSSNGYTVTITSGAGTQNVAFTVSGVLPTVTDTITATSSDGSTGVDSITITLQSSVASSTGVSNTGTSTGISNTGAPTLIGG